MKLKPIIGDFLFWTFVGIGVCLIIAKGVHLGITLHLDKERARLCVPHHEPGLQREWRT